MPGLSYAEFASNAYGVESTPLDYTVADAPKTKIYHAVSIEVDGQVLGRIQSWNTSGAYTRAGKLVYEISAKTWGLPVDYVPGICNGFGLVAEVMEMWGKEAEVQLGLGATQFNNLNQQNRPFTAQEWWFKGVASYCRWTYRGCWLTDLNEHQFTAEGDGMVARDVHLTYVSRNCTARS